MGLNLTVNRNSSQWSTGSREGGKKVSLRSCERGGPKFESWRQAVYHHRVRPSRQRITHTPTNFNWLRFRESGALRAAWAEEARKGVTVKIQQRRAIQSISQSMGAHAGELESVDLRNHQHEPQFGFKERSEVSKLLCFHKRPVDIMQERKCWVEWIFLDLKNDFDRVAHERIFWKPKTYGGVQGKLSGWRATWQKTDEGCLKLQAGLCQP